ncbi:MAG: MFS transporter [Alphaproteobacteria bacterium]|nr:MFS transporter [Alphaproteobacteria bacterium]
MTATKTGARRRYTLREYLNPRVLVMLALGFSSGLPFVLVGNTFGYWLRDEGTTLSAIGFLSWVGIAYSLKFLWAPLLDRLGVPGLGRLGHRRGWILLMQLVIGAGLIAMAISGTSHGLVALGICALVVAFASSTQDIAIDAWRIESARSKDELGLLTSGYTIGYRMALLMSEAVILPIAQRIGWNDAYIIYGVVMFAAIAATLVAAEPVQAERALDAKEQEAPLWTPRGFFDAVVGPFVAFFRTFGPSALLILAAISLFQLPNFVSGPMYNPMYVDLGITKDVVGAVRGSIGLVGVFLGVAAGGILTLRLGLMPAVIFGCLGQMLGTALYAVLPFAHDPLTFAVVMGLDNFAIAMAGVTLVAYMSSLTSLGYTATQYALLSSTYAWAGKILKGFSGEVVEGLSAHVGLMNAYALFFLGCGAIGIPALILFVILGRPRPGATVKPA